MIFFGINLIYFSCKYGDALENERDYFRLAKKYKFNKNREETISILINNLEKCGYLLEKKLYIEDNNYLNIYTRKENEIIEILGILDIHSLTDKIKNKLKIDTDFLKKYLDHYQKSEVIFFFCSDKLNNNLKSVVVKSDYDYAKENYSVISNVAVVFDLNTLYIMNIMGGRFQNLSSKYHFKSVQKKVFNLLSIGDE